MATRAKTPQLTFEASARLQRLLGRELITDDYSAVEELVKNAYDSNAIEVRIAIRPAIGSFHGEILIEDNGSGLTLEEFRRVWMRPGYSEKTATPLSKTRRIQVGEKGIGRFAADKLGEKLIVTTKTAGQKLALRVHFDWNRFSDQRRRLSSITVPYEFTERVPSFDQERSGTILEIRRLRAQWDAKVITELRRSLSRLLNPYDLDKMFKIVLEVPEPRLSGPIVPSEIEDADFEWNVTRLEGGKTVIRRRTRVNPEADGGLVKWKVHEDVVQGPLPPEREFGPLHARFFYFIDRPKKGSVGDNIPGVHVYRDGIKVEPAGSRSADWLGLVAERAKRAGHMPLVPTRLFGFVEIRRDRNPRLQDATDRRAFISGPAFEAFTDTLKAWLQGFREQLEEEVAKPRWERSRRLESHRFVQARFKILSVLSLGLAHELRQPLQAIFTAADNIRDYLSARGIEIPEVQVAVATIASSVERINKQITFLQHIGSERTDVEGFRLSEAVHLVVDSFRTQTAAINIALQLDIKRDSEVEFNRWTLEAALTNLIHNAYQAIQSTSEGQPHSITVILSRQGSTARIVVEDDGPGVAEPVRRRLFRRATTSKQGGMGVALFIWKEALQLFGGDLDCVSFSGPTQFAISIPVE